MIAGYQIAQKIYFDGMAPVGAYLLLFRKIKTVFLAPVLAFVLR